MQNGLLVGARRNSNVITRNAQQFRRWCSKIIDAQNALQMAAVADGTMATEVDLELHQMEDTLRSRIIKAEEAALLSWSRFLLQPFLLEDILYSDDDAATGSLSNIDTYVRSCIERRRKFNGRVDASSGDELLSQILLLKNKLLKDW